MHLSRFPSSAGRGIKFHEVLCNGNVWGVCPFDRGGARFGISVINWPLVLSTMVSTASTTVSTASWFWASWILSWIMRKRNKWTNRIVGNNDIIWSKWTISINGFNDFLNTCIVVSTTLCNDDTILSEEEDIYLQDPLHEKPSLHEPQLQFFNAWSPRQIFQL